MSEKQQFGLAAAAFVAGVAWGTFRHRQNGHAGALALLQGCEWFIAYGGAAVLIGWLRTALDPADEDGPDDLVDERVTRIRRVVSEQSSAD